MPLDVPFVAFELARYFGDELLIPQFPAQAFGELLSNLVCAAAIFTLDGYYCPCKVSNDPQRLQSPALDRAIHLFNRSKVTRWRYWY